MAEAIAAKASLALAVKLKKIFEKEDNFLTFPTALGFSDEYLQFMSDPFKTSLSAQEQLNYKADFARQMNFIPEDKPLFAADASRFLWDEFELILKDSIFAKSALTQEEEGQLAEAIDFLTDEEVDSDGNRIPVNSPQVSEYYKYKTLSDEAERIYLDEKISVEFNKGPDSQELMEKWKAYREKQLREERDKAMQAWIDHGFKRQVEHCQALRNNLELKKYLNLYRQNCLNELAISEISDLNGGGIGFCTTFFSPADAFNKNLPWTSVTLGKSEISGLIQEAQPALKALFGGESSGDTIEAMSLEYNNVVVIRPWFKADFFQSRYWRLPDDKVVSDGQVPGKGRLPAFITSLIVARNIRITRRKEQADQRVVMPLFSRIPLQSMSSTTFQVSPAVKPPTPRPAIAPRLHTMTKAAVRAPAPAAARAPAAAAALAHRSSFIRIMPTAHAVRPAGTVFAKEPGIAQSKLFYANAKFRGTTIKMPPQRPVPPRPVSGSVIRPLPAGDQFVTETVSLNGVTVLAMVCKRLPKSPDPELSLQW